jgi:protoheme IX farnesyltransferase
LPSGKVNPQAALVFGIILGGTGLAVMGFLVNPPAAILSLFAMAYYAAAYTLWLKQRAIWGTIAGSVAGALPPLIGWTAVTRSLNAASVLLAVVIVLWTLPHFWSIAVLHGTDYKRAGFPSLQAKFASRLILITAVLTAVLAFVLGWAAGLSPVYYGVAGLAGIYFILLAVLVALDQRTANLKRLFVYSNVYVAAIFGAMIIDKIIR